MRRVEMAKTKMASETIESKNKAFVLEAFDCPLSFATGLARVQQIGTAATFILRPHLFVSLEASIRECTVNSSLLECHVSGIHSVSEFRRCPRHRLHPCPKLSVAQPVLLRRADRANANIEVHPTKKFGFRFSRASVGFSMSSPVA